MIIRWQFILKLRSQIKDILFILYQFFKFVSNFPGIGVDDLFVIVQSWANIPARIHQSNSVEERIGLALKHAVRIAQGGEGWGGGGGLNIIRHF